MSQAAQRTAAQTTLDRRLAEEAEVHAWRVFQLTELGLAFSVADAIADQIDWHDVASLVHRGCPVSLAVAIVA